jgi:RNA polymerase sigma-70 factor (ECF subfamily)
MNRTPLALHAVATTAQSRQVGHRSLAMRLQEGEIAALAEAYTLYHRPLRAFTQRLLGDEASAEDLVQETFVALPRAMARYDGSCALQTFLIAIAANRARHHIRASARRRSALTRLRQEVSAPHPATPEERVEDECLAATLFSLLDELSVDHRIALVLCEIEDRSSLEAAAILGVSAATVRTRLWHAKRKLRRLITSRGLS